MYTLVLVRLVVKKKMSTNVKSRFRLNSFVNPIWSLHPTQELVSRLEILSFILGLVHFWLWSAVFYGVVVKLFICKYKSQHKSLFTVQPYSSTFLGVLHWWRILKLYSFITKIITFVIRTKEHVQHIDIEPRMFAKLLEHYNCVHYTFFGLKESEFVILFNNKEIDWNTGVAHFEWLG